MAEVNMTVETPPRATYSFAAENAIPSERLPIEERTDVTVDELEKMSLPYPAELYNGKVVFKMANFAHGKIQTRIARELDLYLQQHPIGEVITETNFRLWPDRPGESRIPDIAFVKKERSPKNWYRFPDGAPDLAIEIIFPDERSEEMMDKVDEYLQQGSRMVWLVFPKKREVWTCASLNTYQRVRDVLTAPDLLPGFELPVGKIFEGIPVPD
ncbi:MAG: Uma2 family endonuclease [candidate division KSB1 bacterium]|nr:Uma2 family endonuclease [candidate division KSB1 bacterium]MDZ7364854.1 Uma2 family endonuclease [candidate division KSB1 bacterium]MDZ7402957.1 Uma2 family endonuclease [candidate division KSB1 bacterium]